MLVHFQFHFFQRFTYQKSRFIRFHVRILRFLNLVMGLLNIFTDLFHHPQHPRGSWLLLLGAVLNHQDCAPLFLSYKVNLNPKAKHSFSLVVCCVRSLERHRSRGCPRHPTCCLVSCLRFAPSPLAYYISTSTRLCLHFFG